MKNKKLNLNELKVKSFVTDLENGKENTVKGGGATDRCVSFGCGWSFGCDSEKREVFTGEYVCG